MEATYPWLRHYPTGVPHSIGKPEFGLLSQLFSRANERYPNRTAFECFGAKLSFRSVDKLSTQFAAYLQGLGLMPGDRIAIQLPNILPFPVAFQGAVKAGLIVVNTNPLYTAREMKYQFVDSGVVAVVILENFAATLERIIHETEIRHTIVVGMGDLTGTVRSISINFIVRYVKRLVRPYTIKNAVPFLAALEIGSQQGFVPPFAKPDDTVLLQYTGGTSGVPKGARLSHANLIAHNAMISYWFIPYLRSNANEIMITAIPLYHIFGLSVNMLLMYHCGVKNVLVPNPRDVSGFVRILRKHRFTIITGVNTLFKALLDHPNFSRCDFSRLHGAVGGAMAVQETVARRWEEVTGSPLVEGYGLSETSPVVCCNPLNGEHRKGTIGLPMPSTQVALFDEAGNRLASSQAGEICVRGPQVMNGYWKHDNEDVFFKGEWFRTGDYGEMDSDGFFRILDRKKDMIKVSGFNVYPNEIENVVSQHPGVLEVGAVGVADSRSGEVVKIYVVRRDPMLTSSDIIEFCRNHLTPYKVPRLVKFVEELPKSNVGKILRRALKEG